MDGSASNLDEEEHVTTAEPARLRYEEGLVAARWATCWRTNSYARQGETGVTG